VATGQWDVNFSIYVACRDGKIYTVGSTDVRGKTRGSVRKPLLELDAQAVGLVVADGGHIWVGSMDRVLHRFVRGKAALSLQVPAPITCMELAHVERTRAADLVLVGLKTGDVRVYRDRFLLHSVTLGDAPVALRFGRYSREDNTLAVATKTSGLVVKMLQRSANLDAVASPAQVQDEGPPIPFPKPTQLVLDQATRERVAGPEMHRSFQNDLCKLRLRAAQAYVSLFAEGQPAVDVGAGESRGGPVRPPVRLEVEVSGLGPSFLLRVSVTNLSPRALPGLSIAATCDAQTIRLAKGLVALPLLVPGVAYAAAVQAECLNAAAPPGDVGLFLLHTSAVPLASAVVTMPQSELLE